MYIQDEGAQKVQCRYLWIYHVNSFESGISCFTYSKKNTINFLIEQIETNEPNISSWQYKHTKKIHISTAFRRQYFNQHLIEYSLRKRELWWIKPYSVLLSVAMLIFLKLFYIYNSEKKEEPRFSMKRKICNYKIKEVKIL